MNSIEKVKLIELVTNLQKATQEKRVVFKSNPITVGYQKRAEYLESLIKHAIIILDTEFDLDIFDSCTSKE